MEILGIGPLEILLILVLVLIIFGPKEIDKAGKTIGKSLNAFIRSDTWKSINQTSREIKNLPTRLMREAGLEEFEKAAKENLLLEDHTIHPPTSTPSLEHSPAKTDVKSSAPVDADPTNPPEKTTEE
ncbi:MAG: twin-arginine translocase TatA/TatE family subunit [Chloroflexota bacterium]